MRLVGSVAILATILHAQGTAPKKSADEYPVHANIEGTLDLGAEYLVHSIPTTNGVFFTDEYLVVEVAFITTHKSPIRISSEQFSLTINGKGRILTQTAGLVAASLKNSDWTQRPRTTASAGPVIFGQPRPVERFPGDPSARQPQPPRVPDPPNPSGQQKEEAPPLDVLVQRAALPEGVVETSTSGLLFFPFKGKTKSIRSLELMYGNVRLKLL